MGLDLASKFKEFKSKLKYGRPDKLAIIYFALGYFYEQNSKIAEEALKKGEQYYATHYSARAMIIRRFTVDLFGKFPEKDYYLNMYKLPEPDIVLSMPPEVLHQIAQFCVQNIQVPEEVQDPRILKRELRELLRSYKGRYIERKYVNLLKVYYDYYKKDPMKLMLVLELLMLLMNIDTVLQGIGEQKEEGEEEETTTLPEESVPVLETMEKLAEEAGISLGEEDENEEKEGVKGSPTS